MQAGLLSAPSPDAQGRSQQDLSIRLMSLRTPKKERRLNQEYVGRPGLWQFAGGWAVSRSVSVVLCDAANCQG